MLTQSKLGDNYLTFDEEKHLYILNGSPVPSVTTVNKAANPESHRLTGWKVKEGAKFTIKELQEVPILVKDYPKYYIDEILKRSTSAWSVEAKKAANIGTLVHSYAEEYEKHRCIAKNSETRKLINEHIDRKKIFSCIKKFRRWEMKNKDEIIKSEEIIASIVHNYAGKFDRLAVRGSSIVLSDFKTSSGIFIDNFIQLSAYTIALKEWMNIDVDIIEILRFGKEDGEFEVESIKNKSKIKELQEQFIRNVETYSFHKKWNKKD